VHRTRFASALALAMLAAIVAPTTLTAQVTFQRTYGGADNDYGYSAQPTADGGYILVGHTLSFGAGSTDVYLVKTDAGGNPVWTRTFGGSDNDYGWSVRQAPDGGYVIAGITYSFGRLYGDVYMVKTNSAGEAQWTRTFGGSGSDHGYCAEPTADRGFIIVGKYGRATGYDDVFLVKTDSLGEMRWARTYGGDSTDCGWAVQQTADGGYVIAGNTNSFGASGWDTYLLRTDASGETLWTRTFGGPGIEGGYSVRQTADGGYVVAGETESFGAGNRDVYVVKTDAGGNAIWTKTFGGAARDDGNSIQPTSDGGYVIAGATQSHGAGDVDVYLIKTDSSGDTLWTRTYGGRDWEIGKSVQPTADGGYVVVGHTESFGAGLIDAYLIKTDSLGRAIAVAEPKTSPARDGALSLACEPNPFRSSTVLCVSGRLDRSAVLVRIYDSQGRAVRSFSALLSPPSLTWDGRDDAGRPLPAGAYFIRCDVAGKPVTARIVLQR
jgi:hypothetical protein